jgi:hypothetical protein
VAAFVGAGALAGNATVTPQAISSHANTVVGDILICQLINKSVTANAVTPPDGTWTKLVEATNNAGTVAHRHQYTLFWKRATLAGAQSYTFTKATDDNVLFAGVISTWRAPDLDATALGVTVTTAIADNVAFPAFDPTSTSAHVLYFAYYGLAATTFAVNMVANVNPACAIRYDLESATGTACTLACTSGDSTGAAIAIRTWASASTTDAGNTGVVLALTLEETVPVTQATVSVAGQTVAIPADVVPPVPFNYAWTRTKLDVRQTLIYRPLTVPPGQGPVTDIISVTQGTVTVAGKTVTGIDTGVDVNPVDPAAVVYTGKTVTPTEITSDVIPVASATVSYAGQTVSIGDATPPGNNDVFFAATTTTLRVRRSLIYRPLSATIQFTAPDTVSVTPAAVVFTGKSVTDFDTGPVQFAFTRTVRIARRALLYRSLTPLVRLPAVTDTVTVTQAAVTYTGKTVTLVDRDVIPVLKATVTVIGQAVTVRDADVTPVVKATITLAGKTVTVRDADVTPVLKASISITGKPVIETEIVPILKGTVTFASQTVALVDPGVDRVVVDTGSVVFTGKTIDLSLEISKATVLYTGKPVTLVEREVTPVAKATVLVTGKTVTVRDAEVTSVLKASIVFAGQTVAIIDPGVDRIIVDKADVLFSGQTVVITDTGAVPIQPPSGGISVPPWIDYGRKQRRRYRALEEIEKRLDERIERLKIETKEKQQQVAAVISQPGQIDVLSQQFAELLLQQAFITQALLEAQRRAEAVRQERIQLAILAQRAAEAIDEEEAITMLLLT